jgi:hypothetical protein
MDEKRVIASLRDEIGLAIEASMAVEPAPELRALVRARVEQERAKGRRWLPWPLVAVSALAIVIAVVIVAPWQRGTTATAPTSDIAAVHRATVVPLAGVTQPVAPRSETPIATSRPQYALGSTTRTNDAVLLSAYVDAIRERRIDPSAVSVIGSPSQPLTVSAIGIEPIAIEPLPKLAAIIGERQ